jgi:tRNA (guanine9-N1)-methyltransferase
MNDAGYKRWSNTEWWEEAYNCPWTDEPESKDNIVYLTANSEHELTELSQHETYIIGGLCDRNRYKVVSRVPIPT